MGTRSPKTPYARFQEEHLSLRDELAVDRTILSNERTLLAYVRTGLGFLVLGLTFLHFLEQRYYHVAGYAFIVVAIAVILVGVVRFFRMHSEMQRARSIPSQERRPESSD